MYARGSGAGNQRFSAADSAHQNNPRIARKITIEPLHACSREKSQMERAKHCVLFVVGSSACAGARQSALLSGKRRVSTKTTGPSSRNLVGDDHKVTSTSEATHNFEIFPASPQLGIGDSLLSCLKASQSDLLVHKSEQTRPKEINPNQTQPKRTQPN